MSKALAKKNQNATKKLQNTIFQQANRLLISKSDLEYLA